MKVLILLTLLGAAFAQFTPLCLPNAFYTTSGTACPLTCNNYKNPPQACPAIAISACQCNKGFVRLNDFDYKNPVDSICLPPTQCPPTFPPQPLCPPNAQYTDSGTACPLTCNNYKDPPKNCIAIAISGCQCNKGFVRLTDFDYKNPTNSICIPPTQCPSKFPPQPLCPINAQYTDSGSPCPLTCNNYKNPPQVCPTVVVPGCQCNKGFVRLSDFDFKNPQPSICLPTSQCPPVFPGK